MNFGIKMVGADQTEREGDAMNNDLPTWWPENPYPESVFPMTTEEYVKVVPDEDKRIAISGHLGRLFWNLASKLILEAWRLEQAESKEDKSPSQG